MLHQPIEHRAGNVGQRILLVERIPGVSQNGTRDHQALHALELAHVLLHVCGQIERVLEVHLGQMLVRRVGEHLDHLKRRQRVALLGQHMLGQQLLECDDLVLLVDVLHQLIGVGHAVRQETQLAQTVQRLLSLQILLLALGQRQQTVTGLVELAVLNRVQPVQVLVVLEELAQERRAVHQHLALLALLHVPLEQMLGEALLLELDAVLVQTIVVVQNLADRDQRIEILVLLRQAHRTLVLLHLDQWLDAARPVGLEVLANHLVAVTVRLHDAQLVQVALQHDVRDVDQLLVEQRSRSNVRSLVDGARLEFGLDAVANQQVDLFEERTADALRTGGVRPEAVLRIVLRLTDRLLEAGLVLAEVGDVLENGDQDQTTGHDELEQLLRVQVVAVQAVLLVAVQSGEELVDRRDLPVEVVLVGEVVHRHVAALHDRTDHAVDLIAELFLELLQRIRCDDLLAMLTQQQLRLHRLRLRVVDGQLRPDARVLQEADELDEVLVFLFDLVRDQHGDHAVVHVLRGLRPARIRVRRAVDQFVAQQHHVFVQLEIVSQVAEEIVLDQLLAQLQVLLAVGGERLLQPVVLVRLV